ncbi:tyrosine--tRNA ligase [Carboxydochorda subterranea]|uniref:Tyrosine--tRNA ligase n=1 Tax=Carboxydichorda subterranea TaxID=3109565 RepID=A0ABZ1BWH5_9FIRM|nr:tyrosine--tRNA ligase [Limnochorda sp. L945t]WRP17132.1 tyrosine--tRNA ligase [Limnochorda sp. L945t]
MVTKGVLSFLRERGLVAQVTHEDELARLLDTQPVTVYVGFDPTADSLHVGHLRSIMMLVHLQRAGHRPIALVGGGTAMIGDPSGRTEARPILTRETIAYNAQRFKEQLGRFLDFGNGRALLLDNSEWLLELRYIDFLREIGSQFSVNQMLTADAFRTRMERGLSFIEFNYMVLQAYDFLTLYRRYGCRLQAGGDDQWSNILAGIDLIRRLEHDAAYGLTCPLAVTASGQKMGKTAAGAVWLDASKTSPYDFFQYWRSVDDKDVASFLAIYTLLPMDEVRALSELEGKAINRAKKVLAFEVTRLVHGQQAAEEARQAAEALFESQGGMEEALDGAPSTEVALEELSGGIGIVELLVQCGLVPSRSEARRLIAQGGIYLNEVRVADADFLVTADQLRQGRLLLRKGKKSYHQVVARG